MLTLQDAQLHTIDLTTRMPFRFGIATLTRVKHAFLTVTAGIHGQQARGTAADHLFPKWFTKDPDKTFEEEVDELLRVIRQAVFFARQIEAPTLFLFWKGLYDRQLSWSREQQLEPLLTLFGVTLVERALLDALARHHGTTASQLILTNSLGLDLSLADPGLYGREPADFLPQAPLPSVVARHTVGLTDPLSEEEIPSDEKVEDGLPQSLEACIATYGLTQFKIKVCGLLDRDLPRLRSLARIITRLAPPDFSFSLDGNEQFLSSESFHDFWQEITADPALRDFFRHALFIEQPLNRKVALTPGVAVMGEWDGLPPIIIDESDAVIESTPNALELGYAGTSHKNCKGVIRGILNRCLIAHRAEQSPKGRYLMSGEDLVNIGPLGLLQDLEIQAVLGNESVERNGHHYFTGLKAFPPKTCRRILQAHPDLFHLDEAGWPTLSIRHGRLDLTSLHAAPFAYGFELPLEEYEEVSLSHTILS